jgi:hypothetical protein
VTLTILVTIIFRCFLRDSSSVLSALSSVCQRKPPKAIDATILRVSFQPVTLDDAQSPNPTTSGSKYTALLHDTTGTDHRDEGERRASIILFFGDANSD